MNLHKFSWALAFVLVLLVGTALGSHLHSLTLRNSTKSVNRPIKISAKGAYPHGQFARPGDTISFCRPEGGPFTVDFDPKSPFVGGGKFHFDENDCPGGTNPTPSPALVSASDPSDCDVYPYHLTIDKTPSDPHVIVAGGSVPDFLKQQ